jgi:hypothetical protein
MLSVGHFNFFISFISIPSAINGDPSSSLPFFYLDRDGSLSLFLQNATRLLNDPQIVFSESAFFFFKYAFHAQAFSLSSSSPSSYRLHSRMSYLANQTDSSRSLIVFFS